MVDSSTQCICLVMMVFPTSSKKKMSPNKIHELWWPPPHQHSAQRHQNWRKWSLVKLALLIFYVKKNTYFFHSFSGTGFFPSNATDQPSSLGPPKLFPSRLGVGPKIMGILGQQGFFESKISKITGFRRPINDDRNSPFRGKEIGKPSPKKHTILRRHSFEPCFQGRFWFPFHLGADLSLQNSNTGHKLRRTGWLVVVTVNSMKLVVRRFSWWLFRHFKMKNFQS